MPLGETFNAGRDGSIERAAGAIARLLEFSDLLQDLFIRGPHSVICLSKFPAHYSLLIDYIRGWMRPSFAIRVEKAIAINHSMIGILKQGKSFRAVLRRLEFLAQFFGLLMSVDTHRENL
jgi:hypothetical protein